MVGRIVGVAVGVGGEGVRLGTGLGEIVNVGSAWVGVALGVTPGVLERGA